MDFNKLTGQVGIDTKRYLVSKALIANKDRLSLIKELAAKLAPQTLAFAA